MKNSQKLLFSFILFSIPQLFLAQGIDINGYFKFYETPDTAHYFKMKGLTFIDYFSKKVELDGNTYYQSIRIYSSGGQDTTYFREDEENYYHYDIQTKEESIVLPKKSEIGFKWTESDGSWAYEIVEIKKELKTPEKIYKNVVTVKSTQVSGMDSNKDEEYLIYFAEGLGMVGSSNFGKLSSFLSEVKAANK